MTTPGCKLCAARRAVVRTFPGVTDPNRKAMITIQTKLWASGSTLTWALMRDGTYQVHGERKVSQQRPEWVAALRQSFDYWQGLGIALKFQEISNPHHAMIRATFFKDESWSYVGRDITNIPENQPTMNIGFMSPPTTALHEVGHTLGLEHEHQNPYTKLVWNEQAVIDWAHETQGWPPQEARQQVLERLNPNDLDRKLAGTTWDVTSVMHYPFPAKCIKAPKPYSTTGVAQPTGLSSHDIDTIRRLYPPVSPLRLKELQLITLENPTSGSVHAFEIIPDETKKYLIEKKGGVSDAILVLLDKDGRKIVADDDAGEERDGKLEVELEKGVRYTLNLRVAHVEPAEQHKVAVLMSALSS